MPCTKCTPITVCDRYGRDLRDCNADELYCWYVKILASFARDGFGGRGQYKTRKHYIRKS